MTPAKSSHRRNSEIFHNIESAKDKMVEADPNFKRSRASHQSLKRGSLSIVSYGKKEVSTIQTTLDKFFTKTWKTYFSVFLMF